MCPCDLAQHHVCGHHTKQIADLSAAIAALEKHELELMGSQYDMLRALRGDLGRHDRLAVQIVAHQIKTREWEEANA